jgi:hypothetical protein
MGRGALAPQRSAPAFFFFCVFNHLSVSSLIRCARCAPCPHFLHPNREGAAGEDAPPPGLRCQYEYRRGRARDLPEQQSKVLQNVSLLGVRSNFNRHMAFATDEMFFFSGAGETVRYFVPV